SRIGGCFLPVTDSVERVLDKIGTTDYIFRFIEMFTPGRGRKKAGGRSRRFAPSSRRRRAERKNIVDEDRKWRRNGLKRLDSDSRMAATRSALLRHRRLARRRGQETAEEADRRQERADMIDEGQARLVSQDAEQRRSHSPQ